MMRSTELSVTLTPELFERLKREARELGVALEWLVASLVVDTMEADCPAPAFA